MTLVPVVHAFGLARTAEDPSEDAYAVDIVTARFALADGASSAWRAGDWAAELVAAWVMTPPSKPRSGGRVEAFGRWLDALRRTSTLSAEPSVPQAWFAEAAAERGAYAAFLGLALTGLGGRRPRWTATAVGDVCLLHVRGDGLLLATPVDDPAAFGSHPDLLSSLTGAPIPDPVVAEGSLRAGDMLLLATDAVAAFLLRLDRLHPAADGALWATVRRLDTPGFLRLATEGIAAEQLERDDLTLVRIVMDQGDGA